MKYLLPLACLCLLACNSQPKENTQTKIVEDSVSNQVPEGEQQLRSTLEIYNLETQERRTVFSDTVHFEAPNWSRDGQFLIYNQDGKLYRIAVNGGKPKEINTDFATNCNNDHGISPDGSQLVISHQIDSGNTSLIYTLPIEGGVPNRITPKGPSYWHGWSPDGKTLAYCAARNGNYDIYTIPAEGGREMRLTDAEGLDDGPDYSYDGEYIFFNSVRTGKMKIWRMKPDGSEQEQVTFDEYNDWFAHPSPDNKHIVMVSYDTDVEGHPANKNVRLRLMPFEGGEPQVLFELFGGQGTINVPSWSPDSKEFAFVSYEVL